MKTITSIVLCIFLLHFSNIISAQVIVPTDLSNNVPHGNLHTPSAPDTRDYSSNIDGASYSTAHEDYETNHPKHLKHDRHPKHASREKLEEQQFNVMLQANAPEKTSKEPIAYNPSEAERYKDAPYNPTVNNGENYARNNSHLGLYIGLLALAVFFILVIIYYLK